MIVLLGIGKNKDKEIESLLAHWTKRINKIGKYECHWLPNQSKVKLPVELLKKREQKQFEAYLKPSDILIVLDEKGNNFTSLKFAKNLENLQANSRGRIVFLIGGAFGVTDSLKKKAKSVISLSSLTFSHQLVRIVFTEQIYRALCINRNIPYHHE